LATGTTSSIGGFAHLTGAAALNNAGTLTQTATLRGDGSLHPGGTANNSGTWAFDSTSGGFSLDQDCCSGQNVLNNTGILRKTGRSEERRVGKENNTRGGTVAVNDGTLTLGGGGGTPSTASRVSDGDNGRLEVGGGHV